MASARIRSGILTVLLTIPVSLLADLVIPWAGAGAAFGLAIALGIGMACCAPWLVRVLDRFLLAARRPSLEGLRTELATQNGARGVAEVLAAHLQRLTGAAAVSLRVGNDCLAATPREPDGPPSRRLALEVRERSIGEVLCYGRLRDEPALNRHVRFGALVLENALLAEQASAAERTHIQAQAQRDLQYRLTWTVTTQLCALLEETRGQLETVRLCTRTLPPEVLTRDLETLSARLRQLEAFVQDNLKNANAGVAPNPDYSLARFARPR